MQPWSCRHPSPIPKSQNKCSKKRLFFSGKCFLRPWDWGGVGVDPREHFAKLVSRRQSLRMWSLWNCCRKNHITLETAAAGMLWNT
eukprot:3951612-Amphidinium_carterae.1